MWVDYAWRNIAFQWLFCLCFLLSSPWPLFLPQLALSTSHLDYSNRWSVASGPHFSHSSFQDPSSTNISASRHFPTQEPTVTPWDLLDPIYSHVVGCQPPHLPTHLFLLCSLVLLPDSLVIFSYASLSARFGGGLLSNSSPPASWGTPGGTGGIMTLRFPLLSLSASILPLLHLHSAVH